MDQQPLVQMEAMRAPSGTHDVLWPDSRRWEHVLARFSAAARIAGFGLAITPLIEDVRLFQRGIGQFSDVVSKEMYELTDRGGRRLALRPEGTAPVVRAFVQHRPALPWKAWYATPAFRYERPQAGRYRQHHQVGVEALGTPDPDLDVEVIALASGFYGELGLHEVELICNSMGCATCRPAYVEALRSYLASRADTLCPEHTTSFQASPLRVLDCKTEACRMATDAAPRLIDHLCQDCSAHFERVCSGLDEQGIAHRIEPRLVRGFDYYTRTTFEFVGLALDSAQNAVGGGGRYDGLVEALGGPPTPGIGFGIGIERLLLACDAEGCFQQDATQADVFVVDLVGGHAARSLVGELRAAGVPTARAYDQRSMKAQLKAADRSGAAIALIVGPQEEAAGAVAIRNLRSPRGSGEQDRVARENVLPAILEMAGTAGIVGLWGTAGVESVGGLDGEGVP